MAANKVIVNNQTILDLTGDTVTAATLKKGVTAHDASGAQITGTMEEASTSETWVLNNTVVCGRFGLEAAVTNFISNSQRFIGIASREISELLYYQDEDVVSVFNEENSTWIDTAYRKLVFDTPPTGALLEWLTANGVKQPANLAVQPSKDVTITSNGTTEITPDAPYDVMEKANVTVNVESGSTSVSPKDINFYDYDGTLVAAWELSELAGKTALPDYPTHDGLTCQGWNWTLADLKAENAKMNVGAMYITTDGKTRIYITLQEGRKSPMLGIGVNGTVTVDWGDGTTPDTLTGTSTATVVWTPTHSYAAPGDYVITLTVAGTAVLRGDGGGSYLLRYATGSDNRNRTYSNSIQRVALGRGVTSIGDFAFYNCYSLAQITLPSGVTSIGASMFYNCYSLAQITLPSGVTSIGASMFRNCNSLAQITLPSGVTSIGASMFYYCYSLAQITLPSGVSSIGDYMFRNCYSLAQITLPSGVTSIGTYAISACYGLAFCDFTACASVPTLAATNAFEEIPADCEIRVPAALVNEWKAATNWATYASKIVGV